MRNIKKNVQQGFTLIELLIVVAIIAILAAIAVPNFLEAQVRAKVSRSLADMRTIKTGIESYRVDYGIQPRGGLNWWGFVPGTITTPIAYLSSLPNQVFGDETWVGQSLYGGNEKAIPYIYMHDTGFMQRENGVDFFESTSFVGGDWSQYAPTLLAKMGGPYNPSMHYYFRDLQRSSSYIIGASGPDEVMSTVWRAPALYDPTNGTTSFGDILDFGAGTQSDTRRTD